MTEMGPHIVFINPPSSCVEDDRVEPPLGLLYLAATLKEQGFDHLTLFDMTGCKSEEEISCKIGQIPAGEIYGLSCYSTNYPYVKRIAAHIRQANPAARIVTGGPQPTAMPEFTARDLGADLVVAGEGEDAFALAVRTYSEGGAVGPVLAGAGREEIDRYAFPDRSLVDFSTYSRRLMGQPVLSLLSSRGCEHHCIYCNSVVMGGGNRNVRYRSAGNIVAEIKTLRDRYAFFRFNDDNFSGNPNLKELLACLKDLDIVFRIFARIEDLDEPTCKLLKEAGCVHINIGLESMNEDNLKFLGKLRQAGKEANIRAVKAQGMTLRSSFMVGLPYDTDQTIAKSFEKAARLGIDEFAVYPLIPYPGTALWKHPERFGYQITNTDFTRYVQMGIGRSAGCVLQHKNFTPLDVRRWLDTASEILRVGGVKHMSESSVAS